MKIVTVVLGIVLVTTMAWAEPSGQHPIRDDSGNTLGVLVVCDSCRAPGPKDTCVGGSDDGWLQGKPCGKCLLTANAGVPFQSPRELQVTGRLVDAAGQPVKERFVKMFLANGWGVRGRTGEDGTFRLMLGATQPRTTATPLVVDLGTRVDASTVNTQHFTVYLLPSAYEPCATVAAPPRSGKKQPL